VAAILNFFLLGAGTLYVGRRIPMGIALTLGGLLIRFVEVKVAPLTTGVVSAQWVYLVSGLGLMQVGMAIDGHREAKAAS
jgi:hypothetical protein